MFGLKANKHKVCIDLFTCLSCSTVIVIITICSLLNLVLVMHNSVSVTSFGICILKKEESKCEEGQLISILSHV